LDHISLDRKILEAEGGVEGEEEHQEVEADMAGPRGKRRFMDGT
jgi:hypothetical protein